MLPRREQFSGCLIGQCLGDALGFPVEGCPPRICRAYVQEVLRTERAEVQGRGPFPFGQYTDDSQLARELLLSYLDRGGFDPGDYAGRIAALFAENRVVGRGRATEEAARRLARGVPWERAGTPPPSAGNGSAMRAGPVGLLFFDDPPGLIQAAWDQGRITHQDRRCAAGAVAIAGAVALALRGEAAAPERFLERLSQWVRRVDPATASSVRALARWLVLPPEEAAPRIAREGLDPGAGDPGEGISPFVTASVLWSLYAFLRTRGDYWQTVCTAIAAGGDTDTTAAMAGAISGAHLGLGALPSRLARRVTDRGTWGFTELVDLAHRCYDLKMRLSASPDARDLT